MDAVIAKFVFATKGNDLVEDIAAKVICLNDKFKSYVASYISLIQEMGYSDAGVARLFALERIQEKFYIPDDVMNIIVPVLWADEKLNSEVELAAIKLNEASEDQKPKGFFRRLFGH